MFSTIAIVEDDPEVCDILRISLETRDYRVLVAMDGEAGLRQIIEHKPDLVVLDLKLPGMNGYAVLNKMRQHPTVADTPVVILTSLTDGSPTTDKEWRVRTGVADFLSKPFEPMDLVHRIETILANPASGPKPEG
jgi:DNA-binding response OmpR family regulator